MYLQQLKLITKHKYDKLEVEIKGFGGLIIIAMAFDTCILVTMFITDFSIIIR